MARSKFGTLRAGRTDGGQRSRRATTNRRRDHVATRFVFIASRIAGSTRASSPRCRVGIDAEQHLAERLIVHITRLQLLRNGVNVAEAALEPVGAEHGG